MKLPNVPLNRPGSGAGSQDSGQVSHGLNLVLKLRDAAKMPELLARIHQAQRKIDAGLNELNFVHFARFLPTYDNTALQVITEFDGPLAPYALDFAIEIGDVFDMLLGYTEGTENILPIAEHPAEFLAFVEKHNTVTVPGLPVGEWRVFSAYPEQTVLDIAGPRSDLPIPKADRWATEVEREDVQGNILQGYPAEGVTHFLLRVAEGKASVARQWLAGKADFDDAASSRVISGALWNGESKPELMLNIGLTYAGMKALEIRDSWLAPFPAAFKQGPVTRAEANFDIGTNAPDDWRLGSPKERDVHVMVSLYYRLGAETAFAAAVKELRDSLPGAGLDLLAEHDAFRRKGKNWFGYADAIANPRIATACPVSDKPKDLQPAASAGEFVLGANYKNIYGGSSLGALPAELATNGSFCAVRLLAQDTKTFEDTLNAEAARLNVYPDWLAAKLMGRWYEGAPLSLHHEGKPTEPDENQRNDFDYAPSYEHPDTPMDHAGIRCPVGAHIRRVNPRTARVAGARYTRRLMRRGLHYETKNAELQREVGLFGLFVCADLERQFEFIQRQWINGDRFTAGLRGTRDPFVGTPTSAADEFEIPMPDGPALKVRLPQFVRTKGSLYLFMPGLNALRKLNQFAPNEPPEPAPVTPPSPQQLVASAASSTREAPERTASKLTGKDLLEIARASVGDWPVSPNAKRAQLRAVPLQELRFDPRRRDFQIDPYPVYADFRKNEPVHYSPLYKGWFVFRYDDVVRVCEEDTNFSAEPLSSTGPRGLFTLDLPEHTDVLGRVSNAWNVAATNAGAFVQSSIQSTLDALGSRNSFDLVDDFARPVPRNVYFDILGGTGINGDTRQELDKLARKVMKHHDHTLNDLQRMEGLLAAQELAKQLAQMLAAAGQPNSVYEGSFLAHLAPQVDSDPSGLFNQKVAVTTLVNLTVAGYMSVEFLLATGIRRLLLDRAAGWERIKEKPSTLPSFLQEMRRTEHALSVVDRFAKADIRISGVDIPKGARVFGVLASANRDADVFGADADTFNPDRAWPKKPHLGLGHGTHECMGRFLEPLITWPAIEALVKSMPQLRLRSTAQPPWFENFYFRSFDHLALMRQ